MPSTRSSETPRTEPQTHELAAHVESARSPGRLLTFLDWFLSERLRESSSERTRARLTVGATLFLMLLALIHLARLLGGPMAQGHDLAIGFAVIPGYLVLLSMTRRVATIRGPALVLCGILALALVGSILALDLPMGGTHAVMMLLPAFAVYLLGRGWAIPFTLFLIVTMGTLFPLYLVRPGSGFEPPPHFWESYILASASFLGAWGLGALHNAARDEAQGSLERTLKEKRESEGKLLSLFESTDDLICSLDPRGRLITANSALKRVFSTSLQREPAPGEFFFASLPPSHQELWQQRLAQVGAGQPVHFEESHTLGEKCVTYETHLNPIVGESNQIVGITAFARDISARKEAEARLGRMHRTLVDVSRKAGMAEIATGVLHNVGNTLNSVNISTHLLADLVRKSRVTGLAKAARLLHEHTSDVGSFLASDPQGQKLPDYLLALSERLVEERETLSKELQALNESVEHIKSIVSMQQKHARAAGAIEQLQVPQLIDEALRLEAASLERMGISVKREYAEVPPIHVDRHKLLQILVNLLSNARHALAETPREDRRLTIRVQRTPEGERLLLEVADNGVGIAPENLPRLFAQGFTTKEKGHGFGLHISALTAAEMKGQLRCASPGPGQGATFTLELPLHSGESGLPEPADHGP